MLYYFYLIWGYFFAPISEGGQRALNQGPGSPPGPLKIFRITGGAVTMRVKVVLACTECKQRNYNTKKNKKNDPDRLEMNKYCRFCRKHTLHRETK